MKKTNRLSTKMYSLWTSIASSTKYNGNKKNQNKESMDLDETCTPFSSLDLSGMNKEQAKAELDKIINEKLEKVSKMEFSELDLDTIKRERQIVNADKCIDERRNKNKRKQRKSEEIQLTLTADGSFVDFKQASVFNATEAEDLSEDKVHEFHEESIEGQISMLISHQEDINTSLDSSIDKVFDLCGASIAKLVKKYNITRGLMQQKLVPALKRIEERLELKKLLGSLGASLVDKEEKASDKMYNLFEYIDQKSDDIVVLINNTGKKIHRGSIYIRESAENNKKKLLVGFGAGVLVCAAITVTIGSMTAYEYIYNGKVLGIAKNQEDVYKTIDVIGDKLNSQYEAEVSIDKEKDIRFNKVIAFNQEIDNKEDILNRLTYMRDMKANGYGVVVDGRLVSVLESEKAAKKVLQELKNKFIKNVEGTEYKEIGFAEKVEIKEIETRLGAIKKENQVLEYIMTGAVEKKIHTVQSGETFSEISNIYGIKQSELQDANPEVVPEKLQIGQEISLNQIVPLVTVKTVEIAEYKEAIPYEIEYENTSALYQNEQTVRSTGKNGEKDVVAEITKHNGLEVSRKEINSNIITEPVPQVVLVGTKELPPLIGTGNLTYPIRGKLTSRYGTRWGRLHSGIDLAAPTGTPIKASDGGKVIFSGYNGALGYTVKIDHGGGKVTLYGHCSKLHVKAGDRVYQGQHIANVGSTGSSTGPHVHFEVHVNGVTKNPLNYL